MNTYGPTAIDLHSIRDAHVWAEEWYRIAMDLADRGINPIDLDWMVTWFANAIEAGVSIGMSKAFERE